MKAKTEKDMNQAKKRAREDQTVFIALSLGFCGSGGDAPSADGLSLGNYRVLIKSAQPVKSSRMGELAQSVILALRV